MAINFSNSKRGEIAELERDLASMKIDKRVDALKKVSALYGYKTGYCIYDCR